MSGSPLHRALDLVSQYHCIIQYLDSSVQFLIEHAEIQTSKSPRILYTCQATTPTHILLGILIPPSKRITVPFNITFSIACLARLANSSGLPARRGNSIALSRLFLTLPPIMLVMRLSNRLGAMVTTRMPCRLRSLAMGRVMAVTAPLDAE